MSPLLTPALASRFAGIALSHVTREFPHKLDLVLSGPEDLERPRALHPVFYPNAMIKRGYDRGGAVLAIQVANLEEMSALVLRHGARALGNAQEIPGGASRDFEDPEGYVFELVEMRR